MFVFAKVLLRQQSVSLLAWSKSNHCYDEWFLMPFSCSKDVRLPVQLQRAMAAEAEAAREARAKVSLRRGGPGPALLWLKFASSRPFRLSPPKGNKKPAELSARRLTLCPSLPPPSNCDTCRHSTPFRPRKTQRLFFPCPLTSFRALFRPHRLWRPYRSHQRLVGRPNKKPPHNSVAYIQ